MGDLGIPFELTEVDGVPCFWADAPGPATAGLLFRAGRADETLSSSGVTALAQGLALSEFGARRYDYHGQTGAVTTAFYATGEGVDLVEFLADVCRSLQELPGARIDSEKRALEADAERAEAGDLDRLLMMRFGAAGHGLAFYEPLGLRRLGFSEVEAWARGRFTRGNAALWMTCPPPDSLRLELPDGPRVPASDPQPLPGLDLPAYAASGNSAVASAMVARRSSAIGVAGRTVADRAQALLGLDVDAWQFPLSGDMAHRSLTVDCPEDRAPEALQGLAAIYESVAGQGPTREELHSALDATRNALADPIATAGRLEAMAVDELLGAPRRWKEDLLREAESVSYAEVAAALREALGTQLVLGPASAPKPAESLNDFPWFSRDRVQGMALKPARRDRAAVRLVVSQEGVSHVSGESGRASTVRFDQVAAALQEPDGSLTLIGLDGAIIPLDPRAFKGAGAVVSDLERRLAPELVIPPRDAGPGRGPGIEQVARRKLRERPAVGAELELLSGRLDPHETLVTMAEAVIGFNRGLLTLTDLRVIWIHQGDADPIVRELPYGDVHGVKFSRIPSHVVTLQSPAGETAFARILPKERAPEIVEEIERRAVTARVPAQ